MVLHKAICPAAFAAGRAPRVTTGAHGSSDADRSPMDEVPRVMCAIVKDSIEGPDERGPGIRTWQDRRMAAIGQPTSGIAHDLNNFLTVVMLMTEALLDDLPSESPQHTMARGIRAATERA